MYAFNARFRPTLHFGLFTLPALAIGCLGILLILFSVGATVQMRKPWLSAFMLLPAIACFGIAIKLQLALKTERIRNVLWRGKIEANTPSLESHKNV